MAYINNKKTLAVIRTAYLNLDDLKPTLLWENPNPNNSFVETTLNNLPDMSNYTYLIIGFKDDNGNDKVVRFEKIKYKANAGFNLVYIAQDTSVLFSVSRYIKILNATSIEIKDAYKNQSVNNVYLIPCFIYGTNLLV